jgi:hypothetical protein
MEVGRSIEEMADRRRYQQVSKAVGKGEDGHEV